MDGDFGTTPVKEGREECTEGLHLRQRLLKLRWLRLDSEANRLAAEISKLDCELPRRLPPRAFPTD
jgi:hypothetical protein